MDDTMLSFLSSSLSQPLIKSKPDIMDMQHKWLTFGYRAVYHGLQSRMLIPAVSLYV